MTEPTVTRDAKSLYQEIVVDHGKRPRNEGPLDAASHEATSHNPLCGDRIVVRLRVSGNHVIEARFEAKGCLIVRASASIMTEMVAGRSTTQALALAKRMDALVNDDQAPADVGALEPLRGVREFPARKACATLAWEGLQRALSRGGSAGNEADLTDA